MTYKLQDSLSKQTVNFQPINQGEVRIYLCGPTVYDEPHIGHLRSAYIFDVIKRVLSDDYRVILVRNITDVDDKIIDRANSESVSSASLAEEQLRLYKKNLEDFGIQEVDFEPRATLHIRQMIDMISSLIEKGFAYVSGSNVYYAVRKYEDYGRLSGQNVDEMLDEWRGETGEGKRDALDFALWKASKEGEPFWDSPWGAGRPGWHIECSAMSAQYCGKAFDIHGGGKDLIFPHHENERAQSMACFGSFAHHWIHHGLITIESRKMSKSLGNFITLNAICEKASPDALKLFFLQSHYASDADFTWEKLSGIENSLRSFRLAFEGCAEDGDSSVCTADFNNKFTNALRSDFNTPSAIAVLYDALRESNKLKEQNAHEAGLILTWIRESFRKYFGMFQAKQNGDLMGDAVIKRILETRRQLRAKKLYDLSDRLRDGVASEGLIIEDKGKDSEIKDPDGKISSSVIENLRNLADEVENLMQSRDGG